MSSSMATPQTPPRSSQPRPSISNHKAFIYFVSSFLMILLAVSVSFPRSSLSPHKLAIFNKFLWFVHSIQDKLQNQSPKPHFCVLWMAPFLSGGGYSSEAWSYITAIHGNIKNPLFRLAIEHHGDLESVEFWEGLPQHMKDLALRLHQTQCNMNETIVICHSEPGAWYPPLFRTFPCPPSARRGDFLSLVGRTMFETDRVNPEHVNRCNQMDFIWVPTQFHVSTFTQSGVDPSKVVKVVQPVDVDFFDPLNYEPLDLHSVRKLVLGKPRYSKSVPNTEFVFLSVFKWEYRKGWDVLLKAYLKEFSHDDGVALYLLTNPYHSDDDFGNEISVFVKDSKIERPIDGWALTYVIDSHIAQVDLPRLYKSSDAFVLPSRGEGWGRPLVEAMAMSLPVIATNWSGPMEYLTEDNGYPLPIAKMSEVMEGPFKGHLWAEPSVERLQALMRHVMSNAEEAKAKGRRAREDMISRFSPEIVAQIVINQIHTILSERI